MNRPDYKKVTKEEFIEFFLALAKALDVNHNMVVDPNTGLVLAYREEGKLYIYTGTIS